LNHTEQKKDISIPIKMSKASGSPWFTVLIDLVNQVQVMISASWNLSFTLMSNISQLERLKEVVEKFNMIVLNPTHQLIESMGSEVVLYVDETNRKVYIDTAFKDRACGLIDFGGHLSLSVHANSMLYTLKREDTICNGMSTFGMLKSTDDIDHPVDDCVFINGSATKMTVKYVKSVPFTYDATIGVILSSFDSSGNHVKFCIRNTQEFIETSSLVESWMSSGMYNGRDAQFTTVYTLFDLLDDRQRTIDVYINNITVTRSTAVDADGEVKSDDA
jgi:hypothetical protein